jgi:phosphatidylinositol alpha-1,6-mannosyltransferase
VNLQAVDILGLFPSFEAGSVGGVQASGRDAWRGIVARIGEQRAQALCYETGASKTMAVLRAIRCRCEPAIVLVWHVHLLKLLPFLEQPTSRAILFLHGVECWLEHDVLTRLLLRRVQLILSNSDHTWDKFVSANPRVHATPHRTVHLGAGSRLDVETPTPDRRPAVLMIGRLQKGEDYKGHHQMIEAWPHVLEKTPDAQLWIAGAGDLRSSLEALARHRTPEGSVRFYGHVSDAEKERLIAKCRCLALPSRGEGFGLVYVEAMRMGRPCLVSTMDAGREVVNPPEAGLAVNPDNVPEVADAVRRLLTPGEEWEEWSSRARVRYESHFTTQHFQQRLLTALSYA